MFIAEKGLQRFLIVNASTKNGCHYLPFLLTR